MSAPTPLVADTSVLVDHLRGHAAATALLETALLAGRPLLSSSLCRLEVVAGIRRGETRRTAELLDLIGWWPVDRVILDQAEQLARKHGPATRGVGAVDYVLAATARVVSGELVTCNVKHFPMFPKLAKPY